MEHYQEVMDALSESVVIDESREAPPGVEITMSLIWLAIKAQIMMTSYPAGNKISFYRKPCIPDKKLLWYTMRKSWSLFQKPS